MEKQVAEILSQTNFTSLDWGIVAVYLIVSVVIGLLVRRYVTDMAVWVTIGGFRDIERMFKLIEERRQEE